MNRARAGFADPDYALAFRALDGSFSIAQFKRHAVFYGGAVPDHARQAPYELSDTPLPTHLPVFHSNGDRKSTRLNSSHIPLSRMPSSA